MRKVQSSLGAAKQFVCLTSQGPSSAPTWTTPTTSAGGSNTQVQYNSQHAQPMSNNNTPEQEPALPLHLYPSIAVTLIRPDFRLRLSRHT